MMWTTSALSMTPLFACNPKNETQIVNNLESALKISLAQWSVHLQLQASEINPGDFASLAKNKFGINAIEYASQFYNDVVEDESYWIKMRERASSEEVESLLIMIDDEGDLGATDDLERTTAVENHYKWVHTAKLLGCHSIRVNAFGGSEEQVLRNALIDGMGRLVDYAGKEDINVIIENHGLLSSKASFICDVIKQVNKPNFGTLPDFGNWCMDAEWGSTAKNECKDSYGIYKGVQEFLPYAKAVSAKAYDFDENGDETTIDYYKMIKLIKDSGYKGYIGIEYEGPNYSENEGILLTKSLLEKSIAKNA